MECFFLDQNIDVQLGTQLVAHGIVAVVNAKESAFAVVFYEKSVFDQLPADKSAAKSNGGKG